MLNAKVQAGAAYFTSALVVARVFFPSFRSGCRPLAIFFLGPLPIRSYPLVCFAPFGCIKKLFGLIIW